MGGTTPNYALRFPYIDETITDASTKNVADDIAAVLTSPLDAARNTSLKRASAVSERFATQSFAANTETAISQDNETYDTDGAINIAGQPTRITAPASMGGLYWVHAMVSTINGTAWTSGQIAIAKNGTDFVRRKYWSASGQHVSRLHLTGQIILAAGDFVTMTVLFQGTPNPSTVQDCMLSGQRLTT